MANMGPKPKASELKKRSGAFVRNPQRENKAEPKPTLGNPHKPMIVKRDKIASKKWDEVIGWLENMRILAITDKDIVALYCLTYATWERSEDAIRVDGIVLESGKINPFVGKSQESSNKLLKLIAELGLSPSSRTRLTAGPVEDADPFAEFLRLRKSAKDN